MEDAKTKLKDIADIKSSQTDASQSIKESQGKELSKKEGTTKKNEFVEIKFTGYANGQMFDSNIPEDLKTLHPEAKPQKTIVAIGQGMVPKGLDKELENKALNKQYEVIVSVKDAFGDRKRKLIRIIPLSSFSRQKINPQAGMMLTLDNHMVKILAVSGARVTTDFNNPLSGKELTYKFTITRIVTDEKEKAETFFQFFFQHLPEFEIKDKEIIVKLPIQFEPLIESFKKKFRELLNKDLTFEEKKEEKKEKPKEKAEEKKEEKPQDDTKQ
jgi:FKBP-type peptidyl-prolyl cis-trans isomerase 2